MTRSILVKVVLITLLYDSSGYTEQYDVTPAPNGPAYDYFTADAVASTKTYKDLVTMAHTDKILGWIRAGDLKTAVSDVKYTLDRFANHPKGLQLASMVAALIKQPSLATFYFERALNLYPQYGVTYAQYGAFLLSSGQTDNAIIRLKEAVEKDPKLAGAYALLAKAYTKNGNLELARESGEKARELGYKGETP
jgi:Tfp pilus assembly protein PilF